MMIESERRFDEARLKVLGEGGLSDGIGRLSEKSLHKILKFYIEPSESFHEVSVLGSYADIMNFDGIYEIQTRAAWRLIKKLPKLLEISKVTVVIPVITENSIRWINKETGEISEGRKSSKKENALSALYEIYKLRAFLGNENFNVRLVFLKTEDFRYLDGYGKENHKGATKIDRIPTELVSELTLCSFGDYRNLLPDSLGEIFLEKDLRRFAKYPKKFSSAIIGVLKEADAIRCIGREGRAYLYTKIKTHTE